ncbi:MAG: polysaccharide biosynthesis C-terminal domain-containing protein, partial [Ruminococcus callidus]|nr:polysaccharide biosynthesis C-terminal domain-containing protein [Ruminococcus sp.]MDY6145470.1 polysaccharide biosynthesis C-terminal domain-containing protein [Ruminococcus callidus]
RSLLPGMVFLCFTMPLFSILQGIGRADLPVKYMLPCVAVKLLGNLLFLQIPACSLLGAGLSTSLCYALLFGMTLFSLCRMLGMSLRGLKPILPLCYAATMSITTAYLFRNLTRAMPLPVMLLCSVGSAVVMYGVVLLLLEKTANRLREGLCLRMV